MNLKNLLLAFVLLGATTLPAQVLDLRAYGGINTLQVNTDRNTTTIDGIDYERKVIGETGFNYGFLVSYGKMFYVQSGLKFMDWRLTMFNEHPTTGVEFIDKVTISTMSVPMRVGVRLLPPDAVNIANARAYAGFDGHHVIGVNHREQSELIPTIDSEDFNNFIMNGEFGLGVDVMFLFLDLGYQFGISPAYPNANSKPNFFFANLGARLTL